jgi:hypothetical protein
MDLCVDYGSPSQEPASIGAPSRLLSAKVCQQQIGQYLNVNQCTADAAHCSRRRAPYGRLAMAAAAGSTSGAAGDKSSTLHDL